MTVALRYNNNKDSGKPTIALLPITHMFLPEISTIIEIDGPQHFRPVFGEKNLREYVKHDIIKNGMMLKKGYCVIRIKYLCNTYSRSVDRRLWDLVEPVVNKISKKFPPEAKRLIELEIS